MLNNILKTYVGVLIITVLLTSCVSYKPQPVVSIEPSNMLPDNIGFYITPKKNIYRPYERVQLNLKPNGGKTFEKVTGIKSKQMSKIHLTPLSKVNGDYTYHVDWIKIHNNHHGYRGKTTRITWYLQNNWNGIIPQTPGKYEIEFNISSPVGYWNVKKIHIEIRVKKEDIIPYNELVSGPCYLFFEYEYSARMYNKNWTSYDLCPKERLPYEEMKEFVKKYPYTYFTKMLKTKLKRTKRILVNDSTQYDLEDMKQVDELLEIIE